jgi:hypothetical protein
MSGTESVTSLALDEIRRCVFYTRLRRLWGSVIAGMSTISVPMFHAEFWSTRIDLFVFSEIICRFELDSQSEVAIVSDFEGIGMSPSEFIESIEGCQWESNKAINVVLVHLLGRLIAKSAIDNNSDLDTGRVLRHHVFVRDRVQAAIRRVSE